jgi:phage-related protein
MPGSVGNCVIATPAPVLPANLCLAFSEVLELPVIGNEYRDGTIQRDKQADTPRRRWRLGHRLTAAKLATLQAFWEDRRGTEAFYFYNPYEPAEGQAIGSNHDPTGVSAVGRYTVVFTSNWQAPTTMWRTDVSLELLEVG